MGPMMAQAAHATSAVRLPNDTSQADLAQVLARTAQEPTTAEYLSEANLPQMRKIVLQIPTNTTLEQVAEELREAGEAADAETAPEGFPRYHLWTEQPENIATCLAVAPNRKPKVRDEY